jgi:hypothetical protein
MAIGHILRQRKREILERWRLRVDKKLAGRALDGAALEDGWSAFLDELARRCLRTGDEPVEAPDGSVLGAQRLQLGFDASELVRETGILHAAIVDVAADAGAPLDAVEQQLLVRCLYGVLAGAVAEHGRRCDAAAALAPGRERFSLAGVLADAVADVRDAAAERELAVLVDLATPIEVEGARALLRRALRRVLEGAVAATRSGGRIIARAQILSGGRARIDIQDESGGGGVVPVPVDGWMRGAIGANGGIVHARRLPGIGCLVTIDVPGRGDEEPCCEGQAATGR